MTRAGDFILVAHPNGYVCPACGARVSRVWQHVPTERYVACETCAKKEAA